MINLGPRSRRDDSARPRPINKERSWREGFEARVENTINEIRLQVENNRRKIAEQWEVMQKIKTRYNEIMVMIENLHVTMYSSQTLPKIASGSGTKTRKKGIPDSGKNRIIIISEDYGGETQFTNPTAMMSLTAKRSKPYFF
jgi:hypothetical protein